MSDYTKEIEQDEMILAAIIAGGMASGRQVAPAIADFATGQKGHTNGWGVELGCTSRGPCCAVGAGVLFAGTRKVPDALQEFMRVHDVDHVYASYISYGFEHHEETLPTWVPDDSRRARGQSVGAAAYDFFCGDEP